MEMITYHEFEVSKTLEADYVYNMHKVPTSLVLYRSCFKAKSTLQ